MSDFANILLALSFIAVTFVSGDYEHSQYIITDPEKLSEGVSRLSGYTEPYDPNVFTSVPGCPKSENGYPWILYTTKDHGERCFLAGTQGPCAQDEVLFMVNQSMYGFCNCACLFNDGKDGEDFRLSSNETWTCIQGRQDQLVFMPEYKKCFRLNEQGPCRDDELLVIDDGFGKQNGSNRSPVSRTIVKCKPRPCPPGQILAEGSLKNCVPLPTKTQRGKKTHSQSNKLASAIILSRICEAQDKAYSRLLQKCVRKLERSTSLLMIG